MILKVLGFIFMAVGALMVYAAGWIVKKFDLGHDVQVNFEHNMEGDEITRFKNDRAAANMKILGMLVMLPGLILIIIAFK